MTKLMWSPDKLRIENSQMSKFQKFLGISGDYQALHDYSVTHKNHFWKKIIDFFHIKYSGSLDPVNLDDSFKSYSWFSKVQMNFSENLLKNGLDDQTAFNFQHESGLTKKVTYKNLRECVASLARELKTTMKEGDVLAAYMPNIPETAIAMLATNSFGGVFTSTSCDFGLEGVVDRFIQSRPKILIAATHYTYGGKEIDLTERLLQLEERLPFLEKIILVDFLGKIIDCSRFKKAVLYSDILKSKADLTFVDLPFSHPLYIMYSSGTTGKPKCIVHCQGGTLLCHVKELGLHTDLSSEKKIFFFTTCGWMMWNWLISSLYFGGEVVLYEGSPAYPSPEYFFKMIKRESLTIFGTSPKFLKALEVTNAHFGEGFPSLETILSTGSPLVPEQFDYVYTHIKKDVMLSSISGGTDIIGCFMLGNPNLPVYKGEIQCRGLGLDVAAIDEAGKRLVDQEGELVCMSSFPNRPLYFLNDSNQEIMNAAYFNQNPGVWTHGDFVKVTDSGGVIVLGRSDATLNPGGVRIGTAEIYRQTEKCDFITDSLCVGKPHAGDVDVILFVKLKADGELSLEKKKFIKEMIKKNTTPRHVPKDIFVVSDIPYTRSGKKVEIAVAKILQGKPVSNTEAIVNPECLKEFEKYK